MAEPNDKNSPQWRDWKTRHILGGDCVERLKIAVLKAENLLVVKEFLKDLESRVNK